MKQLLGFAPWLGAALAAGLLVGCGNKDSVDTSRVEETFATAEAATKSAVEKAVNAVKSQDYGAALDSMQKALAEVKLTPEQKEALGDLVQRTKARLSEAAETAGQAAKDAAETAKEAADKAKTGAGKALEDLGKSLQK